MALGEKETTPICLFCGPPVQKEADKNQQLHIFNAIQQCENDYLVIFWVTKKNKKWCALTNPNHYIAEDYGAL